MELISDNPIKEANADLLNRNHSAEEFAKHIFSFDYKEGLVVGICGEWGCGKTSYINLMRPELEKNAIVIDFNPWLFSDTHNLVSLFFTEMATQLKENPKYSETIKNLKDLAKVLGVLGEMFSIFSSIPNFGLIGKVLEFISKKSKSEKSLQQQREKLIGILEKVEKPIIVILDDVDRLSSDELQSILKLVRLTGNFPNIIYLLSFDRERVAKTLDDSNIDGEAYLEKIIQVPFDLPKVSHQLLQDNLFKSLNDILGNDIDLDKTRWSGVYFDIVKPNIKNIRDVRRYTSSVAYTFNQFKNEIDSVDLITIELVRIFYPQTFRKIFELREHIFSLDKNEESKKILKDFSQNDILGKAILEHIFDVTNLDSNSRYFSSANNFKKNKRIADLVFFDLYFEHAISPEFQEVQLSQKLWKLMGSDEFKNALEMIPDRNLENVVRNLTDYESEFTSTIALHSIPALYDNINRVPERELGFLEFGPKMTWSRLVYRLLRQIPENDRVEIITKLLEYCNLYGQLEIVGIIGHREGRGHQLVSQEQANEFEKILQKNIKDSSCSELSDTYSLSNVLYYFVSTGNAINKDILKSENVLYALIKSSVSERKQQRGNDPIIYRENILLWDVLIKIYDDEELLNKMIDKISQDYKFNQDESVILAIKYRKGYRHDENFSGDDE